jgi:hypothetical protein
MKYNWKEEFWKHIEKDAENSKLERYADNFKNELMKTSENYLIGGDLKSSLN